MKSGFLTTLEARRRTDKIWVISGPLKYWSEGLNAMAIVPPWLDPDYAKDWDEDSCFETDFASVPRIPIIYELWGDRAHEEAVLHDFVYCTDGTIFVYSDEARGDEGYRHPLAKIIGTRTVTFDEANDLFLEAMVSTGTSIGIRKPMYWGVKMGGRKYYHKRGVRDTV